MGARFSTTSCVGFFVVFTVPPPSASGSGTCPAYLGILLRSLVESLNYPGISTLSGLNFPIVSILVRLSSRGHRTGSSLVKTFRKLSLNSVFMSLTSAAGMPG